MTVLVACFDRHVTKLWTLPDHCQAYLIYGFWYKKIYPLRIMSYME